MTKPSTRHAALVGLFVVALYAICLLWSLFITDPAVANFHLLSLKLTFPGFQGFSVGSIIWGGVLAFVYGFLASLVYHAFHGRCCTGMRSSP
ncbi:MAG: hypothetical protein HYV42_04035 [Candidatus Magasanikbacteria bacterium]|nr:hypothetical protein [Candidatus Magasanikbacteria bacterium]